MSDARPGPAHPALRGRVAADVAVLGGGLAGLAVAWHLATADPAVRVIVLERARVGAGGSGRHPGLAVAGLGPDPAALQEDHGRARLLALFRLSRASLDGLREVVTREGIDAALRPVVTHRTLVPDAAARLRTTRAFLAEAGSSAVEEGGALVVPGDLELEPAALLADLAAAVVRRGGVVHEESAVVAVRSRDTGVLVETAAGEVVAARAVFALGAWLPGLDDWARECTLPARAQGLTTAPLAARLAGLPRSHGPGFALALQDQAGRLRVAEGCQPANRGDPFDAAPDATVQARLQTFLRDLLPGPPPAVTSREAFPLLYTCDGLPLVGPHPGRAACLIAAGFNGQDLSYALVAGRIVAELLIGGTSAVGDATLLSPRRLL